MTEYEIVIGLEVHTHLKTKTKLFCNCSTEFGKVPNSNICPVCTGQPGALPVLNKEVVDLAIRFGLAVNGEVQKHNLFARKNYFYPDLPKGYQISQFELPIVKGGQIEIKREDGTTKKIGITRAHMEEDAGKLVHQGADGIEGSHSSYVDLNRSSVPLLEIVSEPDIRSPEEARLYLEKLKAILQFSGVSDANMEEGKLRCDANISIRPVGQKEFGTRAEVKNMNSFRGVERAIIAEVERQKEVLAEGGTIVQETRNYDDNTGKTTSMRSKEESHDYRYFPEPDLVPLEIHDKWIERVKKALPELPEQKRERYINDFGLSEYDAGVITLTKDISEFFDAVAKVYRGDKKQIVNWVTTEIMGYLKNNNLTISQTKITPKALVEMLELLDSNTISGKIGKELIIKLIIEGGSAKELVKKSGMQQITDKDEITKIIQKIIDANPNQVAQFKAGKINLKGFFVGQVMKQTQGKANPQLVNQILDKLLAL